MAVPHMAFQPLEDGLVPLLPGVGAIVEVRVGAALEISFNGEGGLEFTGGNVMARGARVGSWVGWVDEVGVGTGVELDPSLHAPPNLVTSSLPNTAPEKMSTSLRNKK